MSRVEGYELHLYCDNINYAIHENDRFPIEYSGENKQDCYRQARKRGWELGKKDYCPKCMKRRNP